MNNAMYDLRLNFDMDEMKQSSGLVFPVGISFDFSSGGRFFLSINSYKCPLERETLSG